MSALKPDTATSKPVKEEDNTTAPAKKKKKKKGKKGKTSDSSDCLDCIRECYGCINTCKCN